MRPHSWSATVLLLGSSLSSAIAHAHTHFGSTPYHEARAWDSFDADNAYQLQLAADTLEVHAGGFQVDELDAELEGARMEKRAAKSAFKYGTTKVRGVSLGGWLVTEPFIKPSLYQKINKANSRVVDEYTFCKYQTAAVAKAALLSHYKTFITESDIQQIAAAGLNHIRIPVGFWALDVASDEPYVQGSLYYLHQAIKWAGANNLRVLIDLHGAPASQNGFDNSGKRGSIGWHKSATAIKRTKNVLLALTAEFSKPAYLNVVTAIQPLNEPAGFESGVTAVTKKFYTDTYPIIRYGGTKKANTLLYTLSEAFQSLSFWKGFLASSSYSNVLIDTHIYTFFDLWQITLSDADRIKQYCSHAAELSAVSAGKNKPIVGEWTPAPTDCGNKIPGVTYTQNDKVQQIGWGSRYDGTFPGSTKIGSCKDRTGKGSTFSTAYKKSLRKFFEVQTSVYEKGNGWIMWTWKMESADDWSYQAGLKYGWIPKDPTAKIYGNQCA